MPSEVAFTINLSWMTALEKKILLKSSCPGFPMNWLELNPHRSCSCLLRLTHCPNYLQLLQCRDHHCWSSHRQGHWPRSSSSNGALRSSSMSHWRGLSTIIFQTDGFPWGFQPQLLDSVTTFVWMINNLYWTSSDFIWTKKVRNYQKKI